VKPAPPRDWVAWLKVVSLASGCVLALGGVVTGGLAVAGVIVGHYAAEPIRQAMKPLTVELSAERTARQAADSTERVARQAFDAQELATRARADSMLATLAARLGNDDSARAAVLVLANRQEMILRKLHMWDRATKQ
jgi:hypothetical protein